MTRTSISIGRKAKAFALFSLVAGVLLATSFLSKPTNAFSGTGAGTEDDPYSISTCSDLGEINNNPDAFYQLSTNINCDGMNPGLIGSQSSPFTGEFRGNGFTISNLTVVTTDNGMGLFGYTSEANIYNFTLDNFVIGGGDSVGALIGSANYTSILYVNVINSNILSTGQYAGGIVGYLGGSSISRSSIEDTIIDGNDVVGGIAGIAIGPSAVTLSYAQGEVNGASNVGGITGQLGAGPALLLDSYIDVIFGDAGSELAGSVQSGASVSGSFIASAPFLGNILEPPLPSWDFDTVWEVRTGDYPGLLPFPQMLCEEPTSTTSTIDAACQTEPALLGDVTWEIQYAFSDSNTWTPLPDQSGPGFDSTITSTLPGTEYKIRFRFIWENLTSAWGLQEALTDGQTDVDGDGVSNKEESLAPNSGDSNDDSIQDYLQGNVTSFLSFISGQYIVVENSCEDNYNLQVGLEPDIQPDTSYNYPAGLVSFVARGCSIGSTQEFNVYFYGEYSSQLAVRKSRGSSYIAIPGATIINTTIGGSAVSKANYQIQDGGELDDDGIADGNIVDPVGLGNEVSQNQGLAETGQNAALIKIVGAILTASAALFLIKFSKGGATNE